MKASGTCVCPGKTRVNFCLSPFSRLARTTTLIPSLNVLHSSANLFGGSLTVKTGHLPRQLPNSAVRALPSNDPDTLVNQDVQIDEAINTHGLCVIFDTPQGQRQVLKGTQLSVSRSTFHMLLGLNGCGKSTLLRVLAGLTMADSGSFTTDRPIGFIFQNPDNQVVLPTVGADVAFGLGRYHLPAAEVSRRVSHALELVNLKAFENRPTHVLSGGQKQRVAIAGALAERPKVLLCDELTTFLDEEDQLSVLKAVRGVVDSGEGVTALWVTHRLEELEYADMASVMQDGKIEITGSPPVVKAYLRSKGAML